MFDSFRTKITLWYVGVLALILIAFAVLTYFLVVRGLEKQTDNNLSEMAQNFRLSLEAEESDEAEKSSAAEVISEVIGESRFRDYSFAVFDENGKLFGSTSTNENLNSPVLSAAQANDFPAFFNFRTNDKKAFRVRREQIEIYSQKFQLLVFYSLENQTDFLENLRLIYFFAVPLTLLLAAIGGYFLARRSLAPVAAMSETAASIGATNLNERLPVKNEKDELGTLAATFNLLLARLENSFEQQRRFMADASHELRTPLAIVRGESEVALLKDNRKTADYRESLAIVHDESLRLTKIVEDLFTLARADAGQFQTNFSELYLDEILTESLRSIRVLAERKNISLEIAELPEMPMRGDEQLLRRLFLNLLDNAVKYNRIGGTVKIKAEKSGENYRVEIEDTGGGINSADQAKIFERFYRADKARSRMMETETGGAGLGLSIAVWIAEIHRAELKLSHSDKTGSVFTVDFTVGK